MAYYLLEKKIIMRRGQSYVKFVNEFLMVNAFVLVLRGIALILMVLLHKKKYLVCFIVVHWVGLCSFCRSFQTVR